jgi:hypothetical protein
MQNTYDKLGLFFEKIKAIGLWQRIFRWRLVRSLSYDAYEEFKSLVEGLHRVSGELERTGNSAATLQNKLSEVSALVAARDETIRQSQSTLNEQGKDIALMREKVEQLTREITLVKQENAAFRQKEDNRRKEHENALAVLTSEIERVRNDRKKEQQERQIAEINRLNSMRETWARHQEEVRSAIKAICQKHTVEYVDTVPFRGNPDNTIRICDEFVIFDAKSPASDDLQNFPSYIKNQAEAVRKYIKEEHVKKDVFLVIPANTVSVIEQFSYNMADYTVYVVTLDVLEPVILCLKKIEDYEFVDQLSPEERENVCRIIGKFAHMTKRRIQIDHFFAWGFLDILTRCKADLPREILDKVIEFEKSEKLNPPQERRSKQIPTSELETDTDRIQREAEAKAVVFPPSVQENLKKLPLYEDEGTGDR